MAIHVYSDGRPYTPALGRYAPRGDIVDSLSQELRNTSDT